MAPLIRPLFRKTLSSCSCSCSSSSSCSRALLICRLQPLPQEFLLKTIGNSLFQTQHRTYITEMRKSAFEGNILRLLRNEIQYELELSPPTQPVAKYGSFTVDSRPGEQWVRLKRKIGDEDIKVEVTMFDGSVPAAKSGGGAGDEVQFHITLIVNIAKCKDVDVLEIMCSAWPDSIEVNRLFIRRGDKMPTQPYLGPEFKELDDELQDALYKFLEERDINDELAVFLHQYMKNKDKTEFIRWMSIVKSFIEKQAK